VKNLANQKHCAAADQNHLFDQSESFSQKLRYPKTWGPSPKLAPNCRGRAISLATTRGPCNATYRGPWFPVLAPWGRCTWHYRGPWLLQELWPRPPYT